MRLLGVEKVSELGPQFVSSEQSHLWKSLSNAEI